MELAGKSTMARIVFDLDGTLIDSAPDIHGIANELLEQEKCDAISLDQARDFIGNGASVFIQKMRAARELPDSEHERLLADYIARYDDAVNLTEVYPGVHEALQSLKEQSHVLGICTNKPISPCRAVLRHLNLDSYFDTVWGGDSLPVHKPDPAPLHAAFDALSGGLKLYIGDSDVDAETARRAQVPFLLFTEGYRKCPIEELPHDVAFSDYSDLPQQIASLE